MSRRKGSGVKADKAYLAEVKELSFKLPEHFYKGLDNLRAIMKIRGAVEILVLLNSFVIRDDNGKIKLMRSGVEHAGTNPLPLFYPYDPEKFSRLRPIAFRHITEKSGHPLSQPVIFSALRKLIELGYVEAIKGPAEERNEVVIKYRLTKEGWLLTSKIESFFRYSKPTP